MSDEQGPISRRGWPGVILWALLVITSLVLMVAGLGRSMFNLGYQPVPGLQKDARGALYILAGTAASTAASASAWSFLHGHPQWVTACVATPAIAAGGAALIWPTSMLRHLVALPGAMAGIIGGLADRGYCRTRRRPDNPGTGR